MRKKEVGVNRETSSPEEVSVISEPSRRKVPSSLAQVGTTVKYTFIDYLRSRRFFILLAIGLIISGLLTVLVGYYRPPDFMPSGLMFFSTWWGLVPNFVLVLSGIFFGGDAISGEFQNKTGYFTIPNPIRRSSIYIGKWISAFFASSIILAIFAAIAVANEMYYFGISNVPYQFWQALAFSWIYLAAVLGFTFFFSALFKSSALSILVTAILLLFGFSTVELLITSVVKIEPWFMLTYGAGIISNVLMPTYPAHFASTHFGPPNGGVTLTSYNATIPEGIAIMLVYFLVTAILGLLLFERKEFT